MRNFLLIAILLIAPVAGAEQICFEVGKPNYDAVEMVSEGQPAEEAKLDCPKYPKLAADWIFCCPEGVQDVNCKKCNSSGALFGHREDLEGDSNHAQ